MVGARTSAALMLSFCRHVIDVIMTSRTQRPPANDPFVSSSRTPWVQLCCPCPLSRRWPYVTGLNCAIQNNNFLFVIKWQPTIHGLEMRMLCHCEHYTARLFTSCFLIYTVNRKKHLNVFVISSTKPDQFWWTLVCIVLNKVAIQWCKRFPPGLSNVSTLRCET